MTEAVISPAAAANHAGFRITPNNSSSTSTGSAATSADTGILSKTGE